jgi:hypothetical protein
MMLLLLSALVFCVTAHESGIEFGGNATIPWQSWQTITIGGGMLVGDSFFKPVTVGTRTITRFTFAIAPNWARNATQTQLQCR